MLCVLNTTLNKLILFYSILFYSILTQCDPLMPCDVKVLFTLVKVMTCCLIGTKPLPGPMILSTVTEFCEI